MISQLGDVAEFVRGITFKPEDVVTPDTPGSVACMRTKNVQQELDLSDVWGVDEALVRRPEQLLRRGDVLVSSANSWNLIGKCCRVPDLPWRSTFGGFVTALRADTQRLEPRYLYRWFSSTNVQATVRSFGQQTTNISNLNIDRCLRLTLPLPSVADQRRIADILDRADALRAKRRDAIALLDTLTQSIFVDMFGDPAKDGQKEWRCVGDLLESATYGTSEKASSSGSIAVLRMNNITPNGQMNLSDLKFMDLTEVDLERYTVKAGDLLFNRTNSPDLVGKTAVFGESTPMAYAGYLIRLRTNTLATPEYLNAFLNGRYGKAKLRGMCKSIIGMANINATEIKAMRIPVPAISLQQQFASRIAGVDKLKAAHLASLAQLDALFASLQHRAFRGEL